MDALVLRHDCFKIDGDAYILSVVSGFWRYEAYADIRRGSLMRWCQMRVRSSKNAEFSLSIAIAYLPYEVPRPLAIYTAACGFLAIARLLLF